MTYRKWTNLAHFINIDEETARALVKARCGAENAAFDEGTMYSIIENAITSGVATKVVRRRGPPGYSSDERFSGLRINKTISIDKNTVELANKLSENNFSGYIERLIWEDSVFDHEIDWK
jgi:hypothetical protein